MSANQPKNQDDLSIKFGDWIRKLRDKNVLLDVGKSAKVTASTISRVENGGNPTLETAIRISHALEGGSAAEFYRFMYSSDPLKITIEGSQEYPTYEDLELFEEKYRTSPKRIGELFTRYLMMILYNSEKGRNANPNLKAILPKEPEAPPPNSPDFIFYLGLDSKLFHWEVVYPPYHRIESLLELYAQENAAIISKDALQFMVLSVQNYLDRISDKKTSIDDSQVETVINIKKKIQHLTSVGGIKLGDILYLDRILSERGELFLIFWRAAETEVKYDHFKSMKFGSTLVRISRWYGFVPVMEFNWLQGLREQLNSTN